MKQQVKIHKVKGNANNPRIIKDHKFKKLVKSIQEFPEMLKLRPIIVDEDMIILGGNMRWKASKEAGLKEVWIEVAEGLTEEQKQEFIVKDNVGFGEWEWDILGNEWDSTKLEDWGLDVWQNLDDTINKINSMEEWVGMPDFEAKDNPYKLIINFETQEDRDEFHKLHPIEIQTKLTKESNAWTTWYPYKERQDLKNIKFDD
tara:strand:+ start:80 stop:685 length:606 start_codon:yes stop_codon:yes gene_type:complete